MFIPTTQSAVLVFLVLSIVCLGLWPLLLKVARWRFEFFIVDFSVGALVLAILAAVTLGTMGSSLSYVDRIAVAGLRSQAMAVAGGFVFGIGILLFMGAVALVGIGAAFLVSGSLAVLVGSALTTLDAERYLLLGGGAACLVVAALIAIKAGTSRLQGPAGSNKAALKTAISHGFRGVVLAVLGGLFMGGTAPLTNSAVWGDLGLGPYAGLLQFCCGMLAAVIVFGFFVMNMGLQGPRGTIPDYLQSRWLSRSWAVVAGAVAGVGALLLMLAEAAPEGVAPTDRMFVLCFGGMVLVGVVSAFTVRREYAGAASKGASPLFTSLALFCVGIVLLALRFPG